jgi:hypothetical protein
LRAHLEVLERTSGITPEQLVPMPYPFEIGYIWDWFGDLCKMRSGGGMGVTRLSAEIVSWQILTHTELTPFELDVIWRLDAVFLAHHNKKDEDD